MSIINTKLTALPEQTAHLASLRYDRAHGIVELAVDNARKCLLRMQKDDGHWVAELQGDTILESEYVLLMTFLGREKEPRVLKAARYILSQERPGGGWSCYPGGPVDISVSVKAYFALKLTGHDIQSPTMRRARRAILELGGAASCNSFTKFYLAFLGQFPYENCASVPPEMMFLPRWFYFNLYAVSSWTRTIVVPLSIFSAFKPVRKLPAEMGIGELFLEPQQKQLWPHPPTRRLVTISNFFLAIDQGIKFYEGLGFKFLRKAAVEKASAWMRAHFEDSDGVGAIFPPIIYTIISLKCLGYADDSSEMIYAIKQLEDLMIEEGDTLRIQPCVSPVWDTGLALNALAFAGASPIQQSVVRAARWLLDRECRMKGDWSLSNPNLEPSGWCFEYRNGFYPDTDDTAMVLMGLARTGQAWEQDSSTPRGEVPRTPRVDDRKPLPAVERSLKWLLGMQDKDGGWAAFDRDINREVLTKIPFADHNAMLDPSCPDITARVLEALGQFGYHPDHPRVVRALAFLEKTQDPRGCWIGRWGVNYIYGTWQVLQGLEAIGYDMSRPMVRRAVEWVKKVQQPGGGWGESCRSYDDVSLAGQGTPTASQTGWALLALIAAGEVDSDAVRNGVHYLVSTQGPDGNWQETEFTGTGFPKVFYLKYHNYRLYFPLMALARYQAALSSRAGQELSGAERKPHMNQVPNYAWSES
jgi:squalene-hopene/tetraprenyl-beta-curcumene cyclase